MCQTNEVQHASGFRGCPTSTGFIRILAVSFVVWAMPACQQPMSVRPAAEPSVPIRSDESSDAVTATGTAAERVSIDVQVPDPDQWLFVEKVREGTVGAWATGLFDAERNKLAIETHDVQQFAIDTERVLIDWERLVILGIDGRNSELRKRDYSILHIELDDHGRWVVLEP